MWDEVSGDIFHRADWKSFESEGRWGEVEIRSFQVTSEIWHPASATLWCDADGWPAPPVKENTRRVLPLIFCHPHPLSGAHFSAAGTLKKKSRLGFYSNCTRTVTLRFMLCVFDAGDEQRTWWEGSQSTIRAPLTSSHCGSREGTK